MTLSKSTGSPEWLPWKVAATATPGISRNSRQTDPKFITYALSTYYESLDTDYPDTVRAPRVQLGYNNSFLLSLGCRLTALTCSPTVADKAVRGYSRGKVSNATVTAMSKVLGTAGGSAWGRVSNLEALLLLLLDPSIILFKRFSSKSVTTLN